MKNELKIIFLGSTKFSFEILKSLIANNFIPKHIFTISEHFNISYSSQAVKNSNYHNFKDICRLYNIPFTVIGNHQKNKLSDHIHVFESLKPDIILVMGWYYLVPKNIRNLSYYGAWGIHASMLPKYRGGAPLSWAIIEGENTTGATLFKLSEGVDDGDIIVQKEVKIKIDDTIKDVYSKITKVSKKMLIDSLASIGTLTPQKQNLENSKIYPQRSPEDGEIDLNKTAKEIHDFIRAQSSPYPGAFLIGIDGKKVIIEKSRLDNK